MSTEFEGCKKCRSFSSFRNSQSGYCMKKNKHTYAPNVKFCEFFKAVKAGSFLKKYELEQEHKEIEGYKYWYADNTF